MGEVMIPPWVRPESPETLRWIDDATIAFQPAFGRGTTQRGIWADPRWGLRRRYRGLRSDEQAAILNALNETRGQFNNLRVTPHTPLRGSFPSTELLSNPTFGSGTTGWTALNNFGFAVSDRIARLTRAQASNTTDVLTAAQLTGLTQYGTYIARSFDMAGRGNFAFGVQLGSTSGAEDYGRTTSSSFGMKTLAAVIPATTAFFGLVDYDAGPNQANDYVHLLFTSFSRGAVVDVGANALLYSDQFDQSAWTKTNVTISANGGTAPDGTATGDALIETAVNAAHAVSQSFSCTSSAQDLAFQCAVLAGTRGFCALEISTAGGSASVYVNLSTGAISTAAASSGNFTNARAYVVDLGNNWRYISIVGRKTGSETSATVTVYAANVTGSTTYLGVAATTAIYVWRATARVSSLPTKLYQSTTPVPAAETLSGSSLPLKGLPVSTSGLLEVGDWFEIAGELKRCTARLNSDAAGLGNVQFRPALSLTPADNEPVIINQPFGRFIYPGGTRELENLFGIYGDCEMNLEEVYA